MSMRSIKSAALAATCLALASSVVTACGEKSTEQSGAGGAAGFAGTPGGAGVGPGMGGSDPNAGGAPFMPPPPRDAGACRKTDESCERTTDCCQGNVCTNNNPVPALNGCKIACQQNSDCASGCCYLFIGGNSGGMCAPGEWCSCGGTGAACSQTQPPCCNTHMCQGTCNQKCTQNSDCATQCCVPVPNIPSTSTCLERIYCPP